MSSSTFEAEEWVEDIAAALDVTGAVVAMSGVVEENVRGLTAYGGGWYRMGSS